MPYIGLLGIHTCTCKHARGKSTGKLKRCSGVLHIIGKWKVQYNYSSGFSPVRPEHSPLLKQSIFPLARSRELDTTKNEQKEQEEEVESPSFLLLHLLVLCYVWTPLHYTLLKIILLRYATANPHQEYHLDGVFFPSWVGLNSVAHLKLNFAESVVKWCPHYRCPRQVHACKCWREGGAQVKSNQIQEQMMLPYIPCHLNLHCFILKELEMVKKKLEYSPDQLNSQIEV
jgi:hypothetical protein